MHFSQIYSGADFEARFTYSGNDLGAVWTREKTVFRVWAPCAQEVWVRLYPCGDKNDPAAAAVIPMRPDVQGTWVAQVPGNLHGVYYTYGILRDGQLQEACDPYARAVGVNGDRAMVIDLASTDPEGWAEDKNPNRDLAFNDMILYEQHIRDASSLTDSPNAGKYTALAQDPSLSHMRQLGITHVHILPMYDFATVDEATPEIPQYNWGYDPKNFNVPEGSYSSDPGNGAVRIREMKEMIHTLHQNGISVVMDVVYNHVYDRENFCLNRIIPGYFSRIDENGRYCSGSCCGNDTATERSMVRKYIVDSVKYWAQEYHIDGFRFDLVGLIDTDTIRAVMAAVGKIRPDVIFYGEGWQMDTRPTKENVSLTVQTNAGLVPGFAFFNDTFRDMLKGSVLRPGTIGYVTGAQDLADLAARVWCADSGWCQEPAQTVQYNSCHDNLTLFDKICSTTPGENQTLQIQRHLLAAAMTLTAQGIPLLHAGEELLRSKNFEDNSYKSSDLINGIRWQHRADPRIQTVFAYYQGLIALRKAHPVLRLTSHDAIHAAIERLPIRGKNALAFLCKGDIPLCIAFNPDLQPVEWMLPPGNWEVLVREDRAGTEPLGVVSEQMVVPSVSAAVLRLRRE